MGYYVHFSATFAARSSELDDVRPLVAKWRAANVAEDRDVDRLLDAMLDLKNYNQGPKGELFTWGVVGNHTSVAAVATALVPLFGELFWQDTYLRSHHRVVLFEEQEQSGLAAAFEIFLHHHEPTLIRHDLPFCWGQG